ncbi:Glycerophosphoryl diester phosphodiesterase family-domain-containing protein [Diaporthe sp. PMI_573]|nr:Glycerophosphoryl diester phosphodiesterase family-domain-containing protein [Diaporthaceae sp. PMI_573]
MADSNQNSALNLLCAYLVLAGRQVEAKTLCFEDILEVFRKLLENIQPLNRWRALLHKDTLGRSVLHYAARYGMTQVCSEIYEQTLRSLGHNSIPDLYVSNIIAEDGWGDTPLSIAVNYGHEEVVKLFLQHLSTSDGHSLLMNGGVTLRHTSHRMIDFAIRSKQSRIAELLIGAFARQLDRRTETQDLLYLASQLGMVSIIQRLVDYIDNIDAGDRLQGRTPLIAASINNHPKAVETLLSVPSCNIRVQDHSGWTAVDHAAFRGRAALVKALLNHEKDPCFRHELKREGSNLAAELPDVKSINDGSKKMAVVPELCHRTELESHIFVNLGSFDLEKDFKILDMDPFRQLLAPMKVPDCSLKLQISGIDCVPVGDTAVRFPILEDLSNDPFHFTSTTIDAAKLLFEVYCSVVGEDCHPSQQKPVGSAIVLLNELRRGLGTSRESLVRDHTIPLASMNENGSTYIGSVTFTFVIARPFQHDSPMPTPSELPLNRKDSTLIVGHRGLGQNDNKHSHLQLGENTLSSFASAIDLGADVIEVYVQVTKDLTTVVYHDFLFSETGTDSPVYTVTFDQFMVPSNLQQDRIGDLEASNPSSTSTDRLPHTLPRPRRSNSTATRVKDDLDFRSRLRSTFEFKEFGFKANVFGECVHGPFTTLQDMLTKIDESVCFDIELKYPMLYEARSWAMDTFATELNLFLDTILHVVYNFSGSRPIFFSSFSPELCILLSSKQHVYPVLFLNDSCNWPTGDIRAVSLQEAMRFAKKWDLAGVVMASEPFVASPILIDFVKSSGLVCGSYGAQNDDPRCAKIQADAHLNAIVVNKVREIAQALKAG